MLMPFVLFILALRAASVLPAGGIGIVAPGRALPTRDSRIARNRVEVAAQRGTSAKQSAVSRSAFVKVSRGQGNLATVPVLKALFA